jgi:hypothetical protein
MENRYMKTMLVVIVLATLGFCTACGTNGSHGARGGSANETTAYVVGTVIDAATGVPVANVKVEGPNGRSTRSDAHGRFEFKNLEVGMEGEIKAATDDGRAARVPLRRLAPGRLEIVLQLSAR